MNRRSLLLGSATLAMFGCQTTTSSTPVVTAVPVTAAAGAAPVLTSEGSDSVSQRDLKIVGVDIVFEPHNYRSYLLAGLSFDEVGRIVKQVYAKALGTATKSGQVEARAEITLKTVWIANEVHSRQMPAMDSVIMSEVSLVLVGSGQKIGPSLNGLNQATFSPKFFGGRTPLPPEDELRLIASHSSQKLVKKIQ